MVHNGDYWHSLAYTTQCSIVYLTKMNFVLKNSLQMLLSGWVTLLDVCLLEFVTFPAFFFRFRHTTIYSVTSTICFKLKQSCTVMYSFFSKIIFRLFLSVKWIILDVFVAENTKYVSEITNVKRKLSPFGLINMRAFSYCISCPVTTPLNF